MGPHIVLNIPVPCDKCRHNSYRPLWADVLLPTYASSRIVHGGICSGLVVMHTSPGLTLHLGHPQCRSHGNKRLVTMTYDPHDDQGDR